jgi:NAD(P)-dependent dehydrogenase (short-subunit alcohol dehydrogenase family)
VGDRLDGKVRIVTGASSGIGRATAIRFRRQIAPRETKPIFCPA